MADFTQAVKWMKEGKKVRMSSWIEDDDFIQRDRESITDESGKIFPINFTHLTVTTWEVKQEPLSIQEIKCAINGHFQAHANIPNNIKMNSKSLERLSRYKIHNFMGMDITIDDSLGDKDCFVWYEKKRENLSDKECLECFQLDGDSVSGFHNFILTDDVKEAVKKLRKDLRKYNFKDHHGHPLENCLEFNKIFGDKLC